MEWNFVAPILKATETFELYLRASTVRTATAATSPAGALPSPPGLPPDRGDAEWGEEYADA